MQDFEMAAPTSLPGMESFYLSQQTSGSKTSTTGSPCSVIHSGDGKDCFGRVGINGLDVPINFHTELTRLDMASSALDGLEWLESPESPYQTRQDSMQVTGTISTLNQQCDTMAYKNPSANVHTSNAVALSSPPKLTKDQSCYEPEVIPSGSQFRLKEQSHCEPSVFHRSQFRPKERTHRDPEVVPNGSQFHSSAPHHVQQEAKCPDEERKRRKNSIPDEYKDAGYWRRRSRNNMSARKSREAKRAKDVCIANKIDQLEKENAMLKVMLANIMMQQQQQQQNYFSQW